MPETVTNSIGMQLVLIPAGSFRMGGDKKLEKAEDHETPRHMVKISGRNPSGGPIKAAATAWVFV
jgi:formylglycine-generating enzyme required for sulfatase activity